MYRIILSTLDNIADRLESQGLYKQATSIDVVSNTIEKLASIPSAQVLRKDFGIGKEDIDKAFLKKIKQVAGEKGFKTRSLGNVGDSELMVVEPAKKNKGKHILLVSGTHGDEVAGPFGLLRYLERVSDETLKMVNLSFIPLLNPTGFRKFTRDNQWGEKTNRSYDDDKKISREGKIFKGNLSLLKEIAADGMITVHEDPKAKVCFIYMYHGKNAEELGEILLDVDRMFFKQRPSMPNEKGKKLKKGIIWDRHEGSFEDWLDKNGIPSIATTETPGSVDFEDRVQANTMLLNSFVDFYIK
jgi:predicted deacylase